MRDVSRKPNVKRSGERLRRLAYEMEALAGRLTIAGYDAEARGVRDVSSRLGNIGRELDHKMHGEIQT